MAIDKETANAMRGFSVVSLWNPKYDGNIGGAIRAASLFKANLVVIGEQKHLKKQGRIERTDPRSSHKHMPIIWTANPLDSLPHNAKAVAIEIAQGSISLCDFEHPESAFYLFGSEDTGIPKDIQAVCDYVVTIPVGSLNLAASVNIVLYDRLCKRRMI